jgi:heme A synthase
VSTEETEAPAPAVPPKADQGPRHRRSRRSAGSRRRPGPLQVFAIAFVLLLAAAVCVGIGNLRANSTLLPVISFYLSGAAVVLTVVALLMPAKRSRREESSEQ